MTAEAPPWSVALLPALVVLVELQREVWIELSGGTGAQLVASGLGLLLTAAVAARYRAPLAAVAVAYGALLGLTLVPGSGDAFVIGPFAAALVGLALGQAADGRQLLVGSALAVGLSICVVAVDDFENSVGSYLSLALLYSAGPIALGRGLRDRARLHAALRANTARQRAERGLVARNAVLDERARIAGELHDVIAHALSAMVVQASGARRLVGRDDGAAADALQAVEVTGREALTEIRSALGVLRAEDDVATLAPQPGLARLPSLLREAERDGLTVTLIADDAADHLPLGVDVTAFRALQEALRCARADGGAEHASVQVRHRPDRLELEIVDDGPARRAPLEIGERVALYGGRIEQGPQDGGAHRVAVRLPRGAVS